MVPESRIGARIPSDTLGESRKILDVVSDPGNDRQGRQLRRGRTLLNPPESEVFFGLLVEGYLTLAECYLVSTPFLSWQMVLIGDPLYRPFGVRRGRPVSRQP